MKLEVGKKYVTGFGYIMECIYKIPEKCEYDFVCIGADGDVGRYYNNGIWELAGGRSENKNNLVKEYKEPRTIDLWVAWEVGTINYNIYDYKPSKWPTDTHVVKKVTLTEGEYDVV